MDEKSKAGVKQTESLHPILPKMLNQLKNTMLGSKTEMGITSLPTMRLFPHPRKKNS